MAFDGLNITFTDEDAARIPDVLLRGTLCLMPLVRGGGLSRLAGLARIRRAGGFCGLAVRWVEWPTLLRERQPVADTPRDWQPVSPGERAQYRPGSEREGHRIDGGGGGEMAPRLAVLASHGGSNMQAVLHRTLAGELDASVVLVISNNSRSGALDRARRQDIPWMHLSGRTHPEPGALDAAICSALLEVNAEVILLAGYMKKLGPVTLEAFRGRILNIHPALLPRHGGHGMYGMRPHEAVLAAGDRESGATVHVVDGEYDHGRVLRQHRVPVLPGDTPQTLQQRVLAVEHTLFSEVVADIAGGRLTLD